MKTTSFAPTLLGLLLLGCSGAAHDDAGAATADDETDATAASQALRGFGFCANGDSYFQVLLDEGDPTLLKVRFQGVSGTVHNNFYVTVLHGDGSWRRTSSS